jgi:hypothetical protein
MSFWRRRIVNAWRRRRERHDADQAVLMAAAVA